jgi:D-alanyl-D-alanine carboxypeptidase
MPGLADAFDLIGEAAEHHLPQTHAAGIALAVTDPQELLGVVVRGFADVSAQTPVRPETRFEIGSISKQFAAIVALQEVEAGRLDLHVSVNDLLPWLDLPEPFGPITLHHLLTHTGGIGIGMGSAPTALGVASMLRELPPTFAPGERFYYSNDGYVLVGLVLERITGTPVHDLLRRRILGPLGMGASVGAITDATRLNLAVGYEPLYEDRPPHLNHPLVPGRWIVCNTADGSIVSHVVDMASFARALLGRGGTSVDGNEVRVLSEHAFETITAPFTDTDPPKPGEPTYRYGYGIDVWEQDGRRFIGHSGGMIGHTALLVVDIDSGIGCVALQNGGGDKRPLVQYAIDAVRATVAGASPAPPPHPRPPTAIDGAEGLVGRYVGPRTIELVATSDGLRLVDGPMGIVLERFPDEEDALLVPHAALDRYLLRITRRDDGAVHELGHGPDRFLPDGAQTADTGTGPHEWSSYVGVYRNDISWGPAMRVFLRGGSLRLAGAFTDWIDRELLPQDDGSFAVQEAWRPERVRFERIVDGSATTLWIAGARYYRSFEE